MIRQTVHVDFETYSEIDIKVSGMFRYAEDPSTEALILGYCIDDGPIVGVDLTRPWEQVQPLLTPLFDALYIGAWFCAHNVQFERNIWTKVCKHFPYTPHPRQYDCTASRARMLAIPGSLDGAAGALGLDVRKDPRGKVLMDMFSKPQKDGGRIRSTDRPEDFLAYIEYCRQDVVVERKLDKVLPRLSVVESKAFELDYKINDRGLAVNMELVDRAAAYVEERSEELVKKAVAISGCRPTQREKTMAFLASRGMEVPNLQASTVEALAKQAGTPPDVVELLDHRIELSRAGTKKLKAIQNTVSADGRIRGGFLFSAASTRRWSSTGVQIHNLQKPEGEVNPEILFRLLMSNPSSVSDLFDRPLTAIAQSIRGFFESPEHLLISDYSSVESRGLAWLADEEWVLEAYRKKQDLYKLMASRVYRTPVEQITKDGPLRFMGKQLVLGCGYGMGPPRFIETCAKFGRNISIEESTEAVYGYRNSVPNIIKFWWALDSACIKAVREWKTLRVGRLRFRPATLPNGYKMLFVDMPSGTIAYPNPSVGKEYWNGQLRDSFEFYTPLGSGWVKTRTFGGSLAENFVQALTRDILRDGMIAADEAGHKLVAHVHDEAIAEGRNSKDDLEDFQRRLSCSSPWATGFPIDMESFISKRYKK